MAKPTVRPRLFKGTRDRLPAEMIRREKVISVVRQTFERYGFDPLETPAIEHWDILTGKYGEEGEKLIYRLAYKDARTIALRYDLTVPLARVVAMNQDLPKPFKRYQIQPVWRADKPGRGRFREFYQCDIDSVGLASPLVDAEIVAVIAESLRALEMPEFTIRISSRRLLNGLAAFVGVAGRMVRVPLRAGVDEPAGDGEDAFREIAAPVALFRAMDKVDKIGVEGVRAELERIGFEAEAIDRTARLLEYDDGNEETIAFATEIVGDDEDGRAGLAEVAEVFRGAAEMGAPAERLKIDLSLARGLDYYTGPIFETVVTEPKIGSVSGGGRYDDLIEVFGAKAVPATGATLGLERIITVLDEMGRLDAAPTRTRVLVAQIGDGMTEEALRVARDVRDAGVPTEVRFAPGKLGKQIAYAEKRGIGVVVIVAPDEIARGEVGIKDLAKREQVTVPRTEVGARTAAIVGAGAA